MRSPFIVDGNTLDYFESQLAGSAGNEVRVLLLEAIKRGDVYAPFPIQDEYKEKWDPPIFCDDLELKKIFRNTKPADVAAHVGRIGRTYPKVMRRVRKTNRDPGDPWLVATAIAKSGTVVTEELASPNGTAAKQKASLKKLPDICSSESIPVYNGAEFLDWCRENYVI